MDIEINRCKIRRFSLAAMIEMMRDELKNHDITIFGWSGNPIRRRVVESRTTTALLNLQMPLI